MIRSLVTMAVILMLDASAAMAQTYEVCRTPYDYCEPPAGLPIGHPCGCAGDTGVLVWTDENYYFVHQEGGRVCYTNFEACGAELALVGVDCNCSGVPGVIGRWYQ